MLQSDFTLQVFLLQFYSTLSAIRGIELPFIVDFFGERGAERPAPQKYPSDFY